MTCTSMGGRRRRTTGQRTLPHFVACLSPTDVLYCTVCACNPKDFNGLAKAEVLSYIVPEMQMATD